MVRHSHSNVYRAQDRKLTLPDMSQEKVGLCIRARLMQAKTTIIAAKYAYVTKGPQWLSLFARAIDSIEQCPPSHQKALMRELHRFFEVRDELIVAGR